jgi:hypothetical protein
MSRMKGCPCDSLFPSCRVKAGAVFAARRQSVFAWYVFLVCLPSFGFSPCVRNPPLDSPSNLRRYRCAGA